MRNQLLSLLMCAVGCLMGCGAEGSSAEESASVAQALTRPGGETARCSMGADQISLSFAGGGEGSVQVDPIGMNCKYSSAGCAPYLCSGTPVTLTAVPEMGSSFVAWTGACAPFMNKPCSLVLTGDIATTAVFAPPLACRPGAARDCQYCFGQAPLDTERPYAGISECRMDGSGWNECKPQRRRLGPIAATDPMWNHSGTCGSPVGAAWRIPAGTPGALPCPGQLGPYRSLPEGVYDVQFAGYAYGDTTIHVDVRDDSHSTVIGSSPAIKLSRGPFLQTIPFYNYSGCAKLEFRLWWYGGSTIDLQSTTLIPR